MKGPHGHRCDTRISASNLRRHRLRPAGSDRRVGHRPVRPFGHPLGHLDLLESLAIFIIREVAAESERPVLLFSGGKDSAVLLHLAAKAFKPGKIPFPVLHVDTGHNFPEVLDYRERGRSRRWAPGSWWPRCRTPSTRAASPTPARWPRVPVSDDHTARRHKREPLRCRVRAGARRDEGKARAKERVLSFRDSFGQWDPKRQRPELWQLYQGSVRPGEHLRVFPLSDFTELDVWQYILVGEQIALPSIYYADERDVIERDGMLLAVSEWVSPRGAEVVESAMVRYRTVGDATLTGAVRSDAKTVEDIIHEVAASRISERGATRGDDRFSETAMEDRKRVGVLLTP